ncbi:MAG: DNA-binding protein YbaB [Alphaproteobacteria bacterium]|jgi:DNA-binding protein YbaB
MNKLKFIDLMGADAFDTLMLMVQEEPEVVETLFRDAIADLIQNASESSREELKALQVEIDLLQFSMENPIDRCQAIIRMISKRREMLLEKWQELKDTLEGRTVETKPKKGILEVNFDK